jgi:hypothetical protein
LHRACRSATLRVERRRDCRVGLLWWPVGAVIAIGYFGLLFHLHRGVVSIDDGDGY